MGNDNLLEEYTAYYRARMQRYEGNPLYAHSHASEKALYEAMASCRELGEFKDKLGDLNIRNAIALVKDQAAARKKAYEAMKEPLRARGPAEILEKIDAARTDMEVVRITSEIEQKNSNEISIDGFTDVFYYGFLYLEHIEVYETAQVPGKWKSQREGYRAEYVKSLKELYDTVERDARNWRPDWNFRYETVLEERHRRRIPVPDEALKRRIEQTKKLRGK